MNSEDDINKKFYVYIHKRLSDGGIFYVGKGSGNRAWSRSGRSDYWNRIVRKHGRSVEIFMNSMSEPCSYTMEKILISLIGRDNLCNHTDGGEGFPSGHEPWNKDKTIYDFYHSKHGFVSSTRSEMVESYNLNSSDLDYLVNEKFMSIKGWILSKSKDKPIHHDIIKGSGSPRYDHIIRSFTHSDGREFTGTSYEFRNEFNLPQSYVSGLISGKSKSVSGWRLSENNENEVGVAFGIRHANIDMTKYVFTHQNGDVFIGLRYEFYRKYDLKAKSVSSLILGSVKTLYGWSVSKQ